MFCIELFQKNLNTKILGSQIFYHSKTNSTNSDIWKLEDNIRNKEKLQEFDDDFIFYARNIYKVNDKRAQLKRHLNELVNSEIIEEKSYQKY